MGDLAEVLNAGLVGRTAELAAAEQVLEGGASGLIVVSGDDGMGKTSFVAELAHRAAERGWAVAAGLPGRPLRVAATTTEESLAHEVTGALVIPDSRGGVVALSGDSVGSRERDLEPLIGALEHRAPALIVFDGYRPSDEHDDWWRVKLLPDLKRTRSVVFVVSDRPDAVDGLVEHADAVIALGPLDRDDTAAALERLGEHLEPPLEDSEIEVLAAGLASDPALVRPLWRSLALALPHREADEE